MPSHEGRISLFIIDDSAIVRQTMLKLLDDVPDIEVLGVAADPIFAMKKIEITGYPDVMILDLEMPRMDGLSYLKQVMREHPMPVIICSAHAQNDNAKAIEALQVGALELIEKPNVNTRTFLEASKDALVDSIRSAYHAKITPNRSTMRAVQRLEQTNSTRNETAQNPQKGSNKRSLFAGGHIVAIGSSTGGVQVLEQILSALPPKTPPILITQHMPAGFTASLAKRLKELCAIEVKEAQEGEVVMPNTAYIAPGAKHLEIKRQGQGFVMAVKEGPKVSRHRPSVDVLFRSMAQEVGARAVGFILTGMGNDGAHGMRDMYQKGATTYAQDELSCVVYGMPLEAVKLGGVTKTLTIEQMIEVIKSTS